MGAGVAVRSGWPERFLQTNAFTWAFDFVYNLTPTILSIRQTLCESFELQPNAAARFEGRSLWKELIRWAGLSRASVEPQDCFRKNLIPCVDGDKNAKIIFGYSGLFLLTNI